MVAKESAWVFPFLGIYDKSKDSNFFCIHLTWLKYSCILVSHASNSPFTCPTTSLESENISTVFPPIFWTIVIPVNKVSYFASLFVAEKPTLRIFQWWSSQEIPELAPLLIPASLLLHPYTSSRVRDTVWRLGQLIFHPCYAAPHLFLQDIQQIQPPSQRGPGLLQQCEAYTSSKAPRIVPHLAILQV